MWRDILSTYMIADDSDYPPHDILTYSIVMNSENETDYGKFSIDGRHRCS